MESQALALSAGAAVVVSIAAEAAVEAAVVATAGA